VAKMFDFLMGFDWHTSRYSLSLSFSLSLSLSLSLGRSYFLSLFDLAATSKNSVIPPQRIVGDIW